MCEEPSKEKFMDWMDMWHVEIEERPRHLWPGKWTITGWWHYEEYLYKNAEYKWEKEEERMWKEKFGDKVLTLQELAAGDGILNCGEDYFRWHVELPTWCLHKDGKWCKVLVGGGIYDSYEEAVDVLSKNLSKAPKFENYEKHLEEGLWHYPLTNVTV